MKEKLSEVMYVLAGVGADVSIGVYRLEKTINPELCGCKAVLSEEDNFQWSLCEDCMSQIEKRESDLPSTEKG